MLRKLQFNFFGAHIMSCERVSYIINVVLACWVSIADPYPMWRKKPWVEHGQAEGKSCIGTQASAPKHCKFYSAPLIFSPGLDAFCCFYSSPKSPASQISPSLLPSSQSLKAGNDGEDRQQKKPPHHFQCWNPFLAPSTFFTTMFSSSTSCFSYYQFHFEGHLNSE